MSVAANTNVETLDRATVDVGELRPKLRDGLTFTPVELAASGQTSRPDTRVEDPHSGQFYVLGYAEYAFLSTLDGETSVAEAMSLAARLFRESRGQQGDGLSLHEATELIRWATANGLFQNVPKQEAAPSPWAIFGAVNPLWMKMSLPSPERVIDVLSPLLGWTQSRVMLAPLIALVVAAAFAGVAHLAEIRSAFAGILAVSNWIPLAVVWTALKLYHELGHALACRRYGVEVRRCGIVFILFTPCPFVDATASWRLSSKWARVHIAAAGMIAELSIAAVVLLAWPAISGGLGFDPVWMRQLAANALFSATAATVLFNANPLMKFDGYYMLSDALNAPNLATRGARVAQRRLANWCLGDAIRTHEPLWIECYGWAAAIWRVVVTVSLTAAASVLLPGVGLAIGVMGAAVSLAPPVIQGLRTLLDRFASGQNFARPCLSVVVLFGLIASLSTPWPFASSLPGVVSLPDEATVRSGLDGFIQVAHVDPGQSVQSNELLLDIRNDEARTRRAELTAEIDRSITRQRMFDADGRLADAQLESQERQRLRRQASLLAAQLEKETVVAPIAGLFESEQGRASECLQTFIKEGDDVGYVIDPSRFTIDVAVPHHMIRHVRGRETHAVTVVTPAGSVGSALIERIAPSATTTPLDPSLLTLAGGPIAVRTTADEEPQAAEPHFEMHVVPSAETTPLLRAGMRVAIEFGTNESTARHIWTAATRWWNNLLHRESAARN